MSSAVLLAALAVLVIGLARVALTTRPDRKRPIPSMLDAALHRYVRGG